VLLRGLGGVDLITLEGVWNVRQLVRTSVRTSVHKKFFWFQ